MIYTGDKKGLFMPVMINGEEHVNMEEGGKMLGLSRTTFRDLCRKHGLKGRTVVGKGKSKFYSKKDIEAIPLVSEEQNE